jgi:hypothetical protein
MALQEFDRNRQQETIDHESESEIGFFARLKNVIENWDSLDDQARKDAIKFYGYSALVAVGGTAAAVGAFLART